MRLTMRSGIKLSISATFSPVPTNLSGIFSCFAILIATPPFESESNLERITPEIPKISLKLVAVFTAS